MHRSIFILSLLVFITASLVEAEKRGSCPNVPAEMVGSCVNLCSSDHECKGMKKCCSNGCGMSCMLPETMQGCRKKCSHHGFDLDADGNPICECCQQTEVHHGECPLSSHVTGSCPERCAHDGNCEANQKCCSNECGRVCVDAVFPEKQGECPAVGDGSSAICITECQYDLDCPGSKKCCENGCGQVCVEPSNGSPSYRPGKCPAAGHLAEGTMGVCAEFCETDLDCPAHHKCCSNGCGHICMVADLLPVIHPGTCPAPSIPQDVLEMYGLCVEACDNDADCDNDQKCCFYDCGHLCMKAIEPVSCPEIMCMMWCPHGFKQDSDGCDICECAHQTVIHEGECPAVAPGTVGICVTSCDHDGSCETNQKCCSNGCGRTCQDAVIPADDSKEGSCPPVSSDVFGICSNLCSGDSDCDGAEKCCSNGCGRVCLEPVTHPVHEGTCPTGDLPNGAVGICAEMCSHDGQCGVNQKCCSNGCGHACITAITTPDGCPEVMCQMFCEHGFKRDDNGCEICSCDSPEGVHPGTCPGGLLDEGMVGTCVELCTNDMDCADTEKCCSNGCGHICIDVMAPPDETDNCPEMMCLMWCERGFKKDQNGCDACECVLEPVPPCPDVLCTLYCPYGNKKDENGCPICICNERPPHCPEILCTMYCENGFQRDENGCEICVCSEAPEIRPGDCPPITPGDSSLTADLCDTDGECPVDQKCCTDGHFFACVDPMAIHEGQCPVVPPGTSGLTCTDECVQDGNCMINQKCCFNGCAQTCVEAFLPIVHDGQCPEVPPGTSGTCEEACEHDGSCLTNQKCCSNGCGHTCVGAVLPIIHEGTCPLVLEGTVGICVEACEQDGNCLTNEKCCSNGCGHSCMEAILPGQCPKVSSDTIGSCVEACQNDDDCTDNQLCCSNGCGHTCMDGVPPVVHEGSCPVGDIPGGEIGICAELCVDDSSCATYQKCCSNGCGHSCIDVSLVKPGECPAVSKNMSGICIEDCHIDAECSGHLKCCSNGCGHVCVGPMPILPKPGMCPNVGPDTIGICIHECEDDHDCTGDKKCCHNGCGTSCSPPVPIDKPGMCPAVPDGSFGICSEECFSDADCPGNDKCCSNGCGHQCSAPVTSTKPGECPAVSPDTPNPVGSCIEACDEDADCPSDYKCCSNGCGHVCVVPSITTKPGNCPALIPYALGQDIEDCSSDADCPVDYDGNQYSCCRIGLSHVCIGPSATRWGRCPTLIHIILGIGIEDCASDAKCPSDYKCCQLGFGHVCVAPSSDLAR